MISADSHINEPPTLWLDRLPARYRDRAPRIERFEQGDAWVIEGALDPINFGSNCSAGLPVEQRSAWITWEQVRVGGYDPAARLVEQDADGVTAEVLYPTPRVSNAVFWNTTDPEFHVSCIRAYNDWLSDYAAHAPDRLWGVALAPNAGVESSVAEVRRALALPGIRGVMIGQYPHGGDKIAPEDDALWALLEEASVPVSIHVGLVTEPQGDKRRMKLTGDMRFFDAPVRAGQFVNSGVFDRFPGLHLMLVEVDSSWIPYLAEQMDDRYGRTAPRERPPLAHLPSHYFATNIASTFITDRYGIANRSRIGVTQMLWSSDFPHGGSDWPDSRKIVAEHFADVPDDERELITAGNARRLYGVGTTPTPL